MYAFKLSENRCIGIYDVLRNLLPENLPVALAAVDEIMLDSNYVDQVEDETLASLATYIEGVGFLYPNRIVRNMMQNFRFSSNLIWCFHGIGTEFSIEDLKFKNLRWKWCYHCADDSWEEISTPSRQIARLIQAAYDVLEIEFPGTINIYINRRYLE